MVYCTALERFTVQGELVELKVAAMAKTLDLGTYQVLNQRANRRTLCPNGLLLLL